MALPPQIGTAGLRLALKADIATAWGVAADHIFVEMPETAPTKADLPRAVIFVGQATLNDGEADSIASPSLRFDVSVIGHFAKPAGGDTQGEALRDAKETNAQALVDVLFSEPLYQGSIWDLWPVTITYGDPEPEAREGAYTISVDFTIEKTQDEEE